MYWFSQVFRWRTAASTAWLLILAVPATLTFQSLVTFTPSQPISWFTGCSLLSLSGVLFMAVFLFSLLAISLLHTFTQTAKLPIYRTRLQLLWSVLHPGHMIVTLFFTVVGGVAGCSLAWLGSYGHLVYPCDSNSNQRCLNEHNLVCSLNGCFVGLCYGAGYYYNKENFLVFPSIQQHKLFRLRGHLTSHILDGLIQTLKILRFFYPLYFFFGFYPKHKVVSYFELHYREEVDLTAVSGLLDISLLLHLLTAGTLLHTCWTFGLRILRVFHTQALVFPVVATFSADSSHLLTSALRGHSQALVKHLGYLDLCSLSIHSVTRRKQAFSLNQQGNPAVWNEVCKECLTLINTLTKRLGGKSPGDRLPSTFTQPHFPQTNGVTQRDWPHIQADQDQSLGLTRRAAFTERAKLWSYSPGTGAIPQPKPLQQAESLTSKVKKMLKAYWSSVKALPGKIGASLKKKPFFDYFLTDLPDTPNQILFADCRLHVWAVTGISELAIASYSEDTYGVVQRTLPQILLSLISLSQALDKHVRTQLSNSKSTRNVRVALETNGKYAVKTAVQTALHRLAVTFNEEKRYFQLSEEQLKYWNAFLVPKTLHN